MSNLYKIEVRRNHDSDWEAFGGPWVRVDAINFLDYWNPKLGWNKYRMVAV